MSSDVARVNVRILEKEYQIACPADQRATLLDCAELLNNKMREIRDSGRVIGLDRIAVMAALNLAHELIDERTDTGRIDDTVGEKIRSLRLRVESVLDHGKQLEL